MNGEVAGVFIFNGSPQNGALAKLWKITGFASYADSTDTVQDNPLAVASIELNVSDGTLFAAGDIIKIEDELLRIWAISTNKLYVIRGYRGTTPASHAQTTTINDETIAEPAQDADEPTAGYQQGSNVTTGVAYGGDGGYRWTAVPEGEYYVSVYYDNHRAWLYAFIETNDPTPSQLLTTDGDILLCNADGVARLAKGTVNQLLIMGTNRPEWGTDSDIPTLVRKTADEIVSNSTTLQNDDALLFAVAANEVWEFTILSRYTATAVADFKFGLTIPAGAAFSALVAGYSATFTNIINTANPSAYMGGGTNYLARIRGVVVNGATAGNLQFQWAQNTAEVSDTTVLANSCIIMHKLA